MTFIRVDHLFKPLLSLELGYLYFGLVGETSHLSRVIMSWIILKLGPIIVMIDVYMVDSHRGIFVILGKTLQMSVSLNLGQPS